MRKINSILSISILLLFLIHAVAGSLQLLGLLRGGIRWLSMVDRLLLVLAALHALIGLKLTVDALLVQRKTGVSYLKENRLFWARRYSGLALTLLIAVHVVHFLGIQGEAFRLKTYDWPQMVWMLLLVLALLVHVLTNIRPLMISFGLAGARIYVKDILFVLSVVLLVAAAAFVFYYLRWNVLWKVG